MNKDTFLNGLFVTIIIFFVGVLMYFLIGGITRPRDVLIKQDSEYLYYKEYTLYGRDSCIYKYHQPIQHDGKCISKRKHSHYVGVPGKGGHVSTKRYTTFEYNGKQLKCLAVITITPIMKATM